MSETYWTSVEYKSQIKEQRIWPFEVSSEIEMCLGYCSLLEAEVMLARYGSKNHGLLAVLPIRNVFRT